LKKIYLEKLTKLKEIMDKVPSKNYFGSYAKVICLVNMGMRYEKISFDTNLSQHPYILVDKIVDETIIMFNNIMETNFIEDQKNTIIDTKSLEKEEKHKELFSEIWNRYNDEEFQEYINRYTFRIEVNKLEPYIQDKKVIDFGCGNGVFCFASNIKGAKEVHGIDFGANSIQYAQNVAKRKNMINAHFKVATVYDTGYENDYFDFAIQNGVFHHTNDENKAIREVKRVLKEKGWLWYYTDGEGGISYDIWDLAVSILEDTPVLFIEKILEGMNLSRNKIAHIMDNLSATYAHTSWDEITNRLKSMGFDNFQRVTGGTDTDFDLDVIEKDPYGKEKFGEGDIRILCQLVKK